MEIDFILVIIFVLLIVLHVTNISILEDIISEQNKEIDKLKNYKII